MKWYWILLIVALVTLLIVWVIKATKTKADVPAEGSVCTINKTTSRTVGPQTILPIALPVKGIIINGQCVAR